MNITRNGSVTEQTYDKDKLAELARLAIGGRTLRTFANLS